MLIGDPSGRTQERKQSLTNEDIVKNTENIERLIKLIFENHQKYFWKDTPKKLVPLKFEDRRAFHFAVERISPRRLDL